MSYNFDIISNEESQAPSRITIFSKATGDLYIQNKQNNKYRYRV
jgi:hypothetical protein